MTYRVQLPAGSPTGTLTGRIQGRPAGREQPCFTVLAGVVSLVWLTDPDKGADRPRQDQTEPN